MFNQKLLMSGLTVLAVSAQLVAGNVQAATTTAKKKTTAATATKKPLAKKASVKTTQAAPATASAAPANTSISDLSVMDRKRFSTSFVNSFYGPSIVKWNDMQPDGQSSDGGGPISTENILGVGYKITDALSIKPNFAFAYVLGDTEADRYSMMDPYLTLAYTNAVKVGNYSMTPQLRYYAGFSRASAQADRIGNFQHRQYHSYSIPNSRFSLNAMGFVQYYLYNQNEEGQRDLRYYIGPSVDFQVSPTVSVGLLYEALAPHLRGDGPLTFARDQLATDLEPNVSWDITPSVNFNPWIDIKTGGKISMDTTSFGSSLTLKL